MEFRVLGPLEVQERGRAVAIGAGKRRALLALLLLHVNEVVPVERLIDELWGERPPATAANALQVYVSQLRKELGTGDRQLLVRRGNGYVLEVAAGDFDVTRFEDGVTAGGQALEAGQPARAADMLGAALALWRGPALADFAYEPFAQGEIARLEELRLVASEQRVEAELALGRHAQLVAELEALVRDHPFREGLRGKLMLALYRCGRQAEALAAYQDARRVLIEELGIEPGRSLRELEKAVLEQDPRLDVASVSQEPQAAASAATTAFVGREVELAELRAGLEAAVAGRGRLVLVAGEPGAGKSRLAEELTREAQARGARVLTGRCWEGGGAPPFWPWIQSLRDYIRETAPELLRSQLGTGAVALAQIMPELREIIPGLPEPTALDSDEARFRLLYATAEFLRKACATRPTVLVLDDLHAADASSLLLLRFLARNLGSMHLFILGAYREVDPVPGQPLREMLVAVGREPCTRRLSLSGLSQGEVTQYVEWTAPTIASPELGTVLHEQTEGNPLFVAETVHLLSVEGIERDCAGGVRLAIPRNVREVIARRLTYLSDTCNRLLSLASVLGREFAVDALAALGGLSVDALLDHLDQAIGAGVVSDVPGIGGRLRFSHVLIRDTLYDDLSAARRMQFHRRAAEALEHQYGASLEDHEETPERVLALARHWSEAGVPERAIAHYRRGGELALRVFATYQAAEALTRAVNLLGQMPESRGRDETELELTEMLGAARGWDSPGYFRARDLCAKLGRAVSPPILRGIAMNFVLRFELAEARDAGMALLAAGERDEDPMLIVEGEYVLGVTSFWEGEFQEARRHLQAAIERYSFDRRETHVTVYAQDPKVVCLSRLAWTLWLLGYPDEAAAVRDSALSFADELNHPFSRCYASIYGVIVSQELDDEPLRARLVETAETLAADKRFELLHTWAAVLRHWSLARRGDPEALIAMRTAIDSLESAGQAPLVSYFRSLLARACLVAGEPRQGLEVVTAALVVAQRTGGRYMESELQRLRGELLVALGADAQDIDTAFGLAHEIACRQDAQALELRATRKLEHRRPTRT
jgi:DNA-binding SARP family transcriptional activator